MKQKIINWVVATLAVVVAAYILPGVAVAGFFTAFVVAIILGLINIFIKPIVLIFTLPINILSLGLFTLVINALLVMLTSYIVPGFFVESFLWAFLFGLIVSLVNAILHKD